MAPWYRIGLKELGVQEFKSHCNDSGHYIELSSECRSLQSRLMINRYGCISSVILPLH